MSDGYYEITIEKLLAVVHSYTDPIRIHVVMGNARFTCEEAKNMRDFYLTKCYRDSWEDKEKKEKERLLKYYKDCPVWNLTVWTDGPYSSASGRQFFCGIEAQCHYKDIREGWLAERNDIKREKRREYYKRKKMEVERD